MPPRKRAPAAPARPLPRPNTAHPCASQLEAALSTLPARPHAASYHAFLTSPYYPAPPSPSPTKKRKKAEPTLPPAVDSALDAAVVQQKLLAWFDGVRATRGMPWRKDVDPATMDEEERTQRGYEVWVSEIMLQQTRVDTVIPYWLKWMAKFPTVKALAEADIEEVNGVWQGLGYYSRAKRLLDGARTVMDSHDGVLPSTADGLLSIDGIGPYSAGAISSIAFGQRSATVDGNVIRVLSRLTALHAPDKAKSTANFIWALADVLVPPQPKRRKKKARDSDGEGGEVGGEGECGVGGKNKPGAWNQALMELGATVCTPKAPKCDECPLSDECLAYAEARYVAHQPKTSSSSSPAPAPDIEDLCDLCAPLPYESTAEARAHGVEVFPMAKEKVKKRDEDSVVCVVEWVASEGDKGDEERKVLLVKRPEKGLLAGLNEFPAIDLAPDSPLPSPKARTKLLNSLLATLLDLPPSTLSPSTDSPPSSPSTTSTSTPRILSRTALPPVTQIYSHLVRTHHAERLVLCSSSPPALRPALSAKEAARAAKKAGADDDALVQSLAGRAKWVDAAEVPTANIGGAVAKVWVERLAVVGGRAAGGVEGKKKAAAGGKGKGKGKAEGKADKGQGSLMGFFAKKEPAPKPSRDKAALVSGQERASEGERDASDDDEVIVVDETTSGGSASVEEKKVYKKRRIAPASDEEDDEAGS
ncbi:hypothetical protein JCM3775_005577 [Rhodotorula graminis]